MNVFLGIDTSCYTTSAALLDEQGGLLSEARCILAVGTHGCGLKQSEMVFQHVRNLPLLFEQLAAALGGRLPRLSAVGVSSCPRPIPSSYMPAFLPGRGMARVLASTHGVPLYEISHQENHIYAGLWSAGGPKAAKFLALHLSGGTTELVEVERTGNRLKLGLLGGTSDISAGQFVDRVGVALGLPFPAGPPLEKLAAAAENPVPVPLAVHGLNVSFSGPATHVLRLLEKGAVPADVAAGVQNAVSGSLVKFLALAMEKTGLTDILCVGGVMSNQFIRAHLKNCLPTAVFWYPEARFSADNATGAAYFASLAQEPCGNSPHTM